MSGSVAAAAKAALVGSSNVLSGLAGMSGVTVAYDPPKDVPRELVYGGRVGGSTKLAAMAAGGRIRREENLTLDLIIEVRKEGQSTSETCEARAVAIGTVIEEYIAANKTLGGVTDLMLAEVIAADMNSWIDPDGCTTQRTLRIGINSFLT